jgi:thiol-disulfide isomerase/thioredoxin
MRPLASLSLALSLWFGVPEIPAAALRIGDPAPKLQVSAWVQGEPVAEFAKDKVYIIEFWATWCGPCIVSIPHLNELHRKYKDKGLVLIGQNCWEPEASDVRRFVKKMAGKMTYRVSLDDQTTHKKGAMAATWLDASERQSIPSAFLVDKTGVVSWIGHAMELDEKMIESALTGSFDIQKARAEYSKSAELQAKLIPIYGEYSKAFDAKEWAAANQALDRIEALSTPSDKERITYLRFIVRLHSGDHAAAQALAASLIPSGSITYNFPTRIASTIVAFENPGKELLAVADEAAERAIFLSERKDAATMNLAARIKFMLGDKQGAIAHQQKAVELAGDEKVKNAFRDSLEAYKAGRLPPAR